MSLPRISLVTPSYNQGRFLEAAIHSVLAQEYPALEWIVMDGGSTDESVEILRRYAKYFAYWTSARDAGQTAALQAGFARATGQVYGWLNSDDVLEPGSLKQVGEFFAAHPDCHFLTGDGVFVSADTSREIYNVRGAAYTFRDLLHYCDDKILPQPGVFFSHTAFQRVGGMDGTLQYAMDVDLWLRLRAEFELCYLPVRLAKMRMHPAAKGQDPAHPNLTEVVQVTRRHWGRVSRTERVRLWFGLRRMQARQDCRYGLERVLQNDSTAARTALARALQRDPFIVTYSPAQKLLVRLLLPPALRARWLRVP